MDLIPVLWVTVLLCAIVLGLAAVIVRVLFRLPKLQKGTIAFFHPFADGGGGGERVLWCAVKAIQQIAPNYKVYIYAREGATPEKLVADAAARFNIHLDQPIHVVPLRRSHLILPERYPRLTLLRQAWGSVGLGYEALSALVPEVYVDTTGWAFTYPLARLAGCRVACYTHYPTISSDMIERVASREATYNNDANIAGSPIKSLFKLLYYRACALLYGACGGCAHATMVNSSWTRAHVARVFWGLPRGGPALVYPPVDSEELQKLPLDRRLKKLFLVSVAQFRPEKNHRLQLEAFALAKRQAGQDLAGQAVRVARLKMVGSCRGPDDERRLRELQAYAEELGIGGDVDWCVNVPFEELRGLLGEAVGGLHSMRDEHFGISVVEYMAAGVIPIAHNSAGPRMDIVVPLPVDPEEEGGTCTLPAALPARCLLPPCRPWPAMTAATRRWRL